MDRDRVVDQIRKLMNLAGNNPNEHEVQAALDMARRLMDKHDIDAVEIDLKATAAKNAEMVNEVDGVRRKGNVEKMDSLIGAACATLCSCRMLLVNQGTHVVMRFIGFPRDIAVAAALSEQLRIVMRTMARVRYGKAWGNPHTSYSVGFAARLVQRADQMQEARSKAPTAAAVKEDANAPRITAIVLAKDGAIQRYYENNYHPTPKPTNKDGSEKKSRALTRLNNAAYEQGWDEGAAVDLGTENRLNGG